MKKKHLLIAVLFGITLGAEFSSCSDYLSVERYFKDRQSEETIFKDKKYSEQWLAQCYSRLTGANLEIGSIGQTVTNFSDDMIFNETDGNTNYRDFKFGQYDYNWTWATYVRCSEGIRQASVLINNIDINEDLTPDEITDMKGQARFLRGYFYWLLLRKYGPVPLLPEETIGIDESYENMSNPRNTYDEVADYIAKEMELAAKELPLARNNRNISRATRGAALATRAKVLLYAASPLANGNTEMVDFVDDEGRILISQTYDESKWARAAAAAKDVIDLGKYELYTAQYRSKPIDEGYPATITPPYNANYSHKRFPEGWANIDPYESYRSLFNGDVYANANCELIFTRGNNAIGDGVKWLAWHQMPRSAGGDNSHGLTLKQCDAYGMNDGTAFNEETYDKGFVTKEDSIEGKYPQVRPGVWKEYVNREPRFYASVAFNGAFWSFSTAKDNIYKNKQIWYYRSGENGRQNSSVRWIPTGIGMMKYVSPRDCNTNDGKISDKVDLAIRYADILLMYAEALNELTQAYEVSAWNGTLYTISRDTEEMSKSISRVRIRAGVPDYDESVYKDREMFRRYLKRERQIEFLGENQRYYDLRRWKDAPKEEAEQIMGYNVLMTKDKAGRFYDRIRVENLQTTFSRKMYFWAVDYGELKHNLRMTQAPGWETYD